MAEPGVGDRWERVAIPKWWCERVEGFSVPRGTQVLVAAYGSMHLIDLAEPTPVLLNPAGDEYEAFDGAANTCRYAGEVWQMLGLYGGEPVLTSPTGEWLELDAAELTLSVYVGNKAVWSAPFESFSGDWAAATFSPDGRYIVVGCPCDVDLRAWRRASTLA